MYVHHLPIGYQTLSMRKLNTLLKSLIACTIVSRKKLMYCILTYKSTDEFLQPLSVLQAFYVRMYVSNYFVRIHAGTVSLCLYQVVSHDFKS